MCVCYVRVCVCYVCMCVCMYPEVDMQSGSTGCPSRDEELVSWMTQQNFDQEAISKVRTTSKMNRC